MKAIVAIEHAMLAAIWNMTASGALCYATTPDPTSTPAATQTKPNAPPSNNRLMGTKSPSSPPGNPN
jgi:hypothetical protein